MKKLSILIPTYNEAERLPELLNRIAAVSLPYTISKEVIVIDDGSIDQTTQAVAHCQTLLPELPLVLLKHTKNRGKGAAIHTGLAAASGDFVLIQDADLEYDPADYNLLLEPVTRGFADVVYGSRFMGGQPHRVLFFWHSIGNKLLTFLSNMFTNLNLTDMESGFKLFRTEMIKQLVLQEKRFGFEPEVTAKISRIPHIRIYEVGISYYGRTYQEGKKVNWKDGFRALYCILLYGLLKK